jgi:hypothetical protein
MRRIAAVFLAMLSTVSAAYVGDGSFVDHGPLAAHQRYVLDLGVVEFNGKVRLEYSLAELPAEEFVIGFRPTSRAAHPAPARVRVLLTNEKNQTVIDESAELSSWVWSEGDPSGLFGYRRGKEKQTPLTNGGVRVSQDQRKPDGGWGTYFTPRSKGKYRLVVEGESKVAASYSLVATGGGWK